MFETLFVKGLRAEGVLADLLLAEGVDVRDLETEYPIRVLNRCVDVACGHLFPDLPLEDARLRVGRSFVQGFVQTLMGRVVAAGLPMLGPVRYLKRFPDHVLMDGSPLRVTLVQVGERSFRMEFRNEFLVMSGFMTGVLQEWLKLTHTEATITTERHSPMSFDLHIAW
ncbi:DUF2378 family protein [Pyxidicoccus parkwayensis]|uniref:DUF2378 family protein n=1 Tax=Pyxidicoccus parkwayensis TaxID=2813578 RepID=A0ABX7NYB4_9BACT|nr:DUF2378 family protein [Pyxidicoccus parkwaysis]QSQ22381.1 DUF2378 family protein [Pyxidicoccus parkwaysis]